MSYLMLVGDTMVSFPLEKTLVYTLWYATLFWLPVRFVSAMIDRHRVIAQYDGPRVVGDTVGYCMGMNVEPPM